MYTSHHGKLIFIVFLLVVFQRISHVSAVGVDEKTQIYVYYDPQYPNSWLSEEDSRTITCALMEYFQGYLVSCETVNASGLLHVMSDLEDASETIVVCSKGMFPDTVWNGKGGSVPEQWIKAGGVLVWTGDVEFFYIGHSDGSDSHEPRYPRVVFGRDLSAYLDVGVEITEFDHEIIPSLRGFMSGRPAEKNQLSGLDYEAYGIGVKGRREFYDPVMVWIGDGALVKVAMHGSEVVSAYMRSLWISEFLTNRFNLTVDPNPSPLTEMVFYNGVVITMDEDTPMAEAVLVRDGEIVAVGDNEEILSHASEIAEYMDLEGRTMLPGFIDAHSHWVNDLYEVDTVEQAIDMTIRHGWTTTANLFTCPDLINQLLYLDSMGEIRNRIELYLRLNWQHQRYTDWYKDYEPGELLTPMIRVAGVKLFTDGGPGSRTAAFTEPYPSEPDNYGTLFFEQEELDQLVEEVHEGGYQMAVHAIGDAAVDQIMDSYEKALDGQSNHGLRHRIEHALFLRDDQVQRLADLEIIASFQSHWASADSTEFYLGNVGEERFNMLARWRDLLDAEVHSAASTDYPYCGYGNTAIQGIYTLVTRKGPILGGEPPDEFRAQRISVEEALRLITIDAAYALHREDVIGSITPGKHGDLVVLSDNPLEVDSESLLDISVWMTVVGGEIEYFCDAPGTSFLTICVEGPGMVSLPPGDYSYPPGKYSYSTDFTLDLLAVPGHPDMENEAFSHWILDGDIIDGDEEITVAMETDHELTAVFHGEQTETEAEPTQEEPEPEPVIEPDTEDDEQPWIIPAYPYLSILFGVLITVFYLKENTSGSKTSHIVYQQY